MFLICFLAIAWVLKGDAHIRMDAFVMRASQRKQHMFSIFACGLGIIYCGFLFWLGTDWLWTSIQMGERFNNITHWPVAIVVAVIPLGSFFLLLEFVRKIVGYVDSLSSRQEDQQ